MQIVVLADLKPRILGSFWECSEEKANDAAVKMGHNSIN
jgi:hypothetical protein